MNTVGSPVSKPENGLREERCFMTIQEHTAINRDKEIVQELARQVLDLSSLEINQKRKDRLRAVNDLHTGLRPGVWLNEIPRFLTRA